MVLGWFNPHFNADTHMTSPEAVQDQEKQKYCIFCVFVTFFSVSKSGNLNNWHFPAKIEGPQGPERSTNRLWWVYIVNIKCQHAQYTSHWMCMAPLLRHISEFDGFPLICVDIEK